MKNNKPLIITLICLLSIIVLFFITFLIFALKGGLGGLKNFRFDFNDKASTNLLLEKEYDNNFTDIKINVDSSDIEIKRNTNNNIKTMIYGDEDKLKKHDVKNDGGILEVNVENKKCIGFCFNRKSKLVIYIPENFDKNIIINNNYGDIKVESFNNAKLDIEEDCGDVIIESASEINVKNNYGDIEINNANNAKVEEECGDVKIGTVNNLNVRNSYGYIIIKKINKYLDIKDDCGDIKIDTISLTENSKIVNDYGDIRINNIKDVYIDAKTDLGDVKINNNYHKSDITLKIENDCGDIEIEN
ncbi:MAG: DUF4097 family beta strand repeat protein [Bacilli bacterium]|nr:DUF4097 family beta strand repeat protein [Bacilli bacterium]